MSTRSSVLSILLVLISFGVASCDSSNPIEVSAKLSDTITIGINEVYQHKQPNFSLKIDSVLNDSRCPIDVQCFWEGNAEVRFKLSSLNSKTIMFNLNTANIFRKDTVIEGVKFKLIELDRQPDIMTRDSYQSYRIKIYYSTLVR
jgi:hypothetical protein